MGQQALYECVECGYGTLVSGGKDQGFEIRTLTVVCKTCKELHDVVSHKPIFDSDDRLTGFRKLKKLRCPEGHEVTAWKHGDPCPKCGASMEITLYGPLYD